MFTECNELLFNRIDQKWFNCNENKGCSHFMHFNYTARCCFVELECASNQLNHNICSRIEWYRIETHNNAFNAPVIKDLLNEYDRKKSVCVLCCHSLIHQMVSIWSVISFSSILSGLMVVVSFHLNLYLVWFFFFLLFVYLLHWLTSEHKPKTRKTTKCRYAYHWIAIMPQKKQFRKSHIFQVCKALLLDRWMDGLALHSVQCSAIPRERQNQTQ